MKSIFAAAVAVIILCACGGNAKAATLPDNFVSQDGRNFQLSHALSVEKQSAPLYSIKVRMVDGNYQTYADGTGAVWSKVLMYMSGPGAAAYQAVPGQNLYINTSFYTEATCFPTLGYKTGIAWPNVPDVLYLNDTCAFSKAVNGRSN